MYVCLSVCLENYTYIPVLSPCTLKRNTHELHPTIFEIVDIEIYRYVLYTNNTIVMDIPCLCELNRETVDSVDTQKGFSSIL